MFCFRYTEITCHMINVYPCPTSGKHLVWTDNLLVKSITRPMSFQSLHVDRSKKLHSSQAGLDSKVPVGCQNDLADLEKEKRKTGKTAVAGTSATTGPLSYMILALTAFMTDSQCTASYCHLFGIYDVVKVMDLTCESHWNLVLSEA